MEKTENQIYEEFARQLCEWTDTGKTPTAGNQDIRYGLDLQKKRLEKYHAKMEYRLKLRGGGLDAISKAVFSDTQYTNQLMWRHYQKSVTYSADGRKCLTVKDDELLYAIITQLNDANVQDTYCCPNCGMISEISTLLEGCPYCKTHFLMSDLFPKVTDYHFLKDYAMNADEAKSRTTKWMLAGALIGIALAFPGAVLGFFRSGSEGVGMSGRIVSAVFSFIVPGIFGAGLGYAAWVVRLLGGMFKDAAKQAPMAAGIINARKQLDAFMKPYDSGFSFEYFIGKVQSLMKILIFTDDRKNLAVCEGAVDAGMFDNMIDAQFGGAISLNKCMTEGNYCHLDLNVHMTDTYCEKNSIIRKPDVFRMVVSRNVSRPVDYGFSIKKVCCKSCGASFDASREKYCPYCRSSYELKEDDWVITYIRKN